MKLISNAATRLSAVVLAVALTACAGPRAPLTVDVGAVPTDILLGAKARAMSTPPLPPEMLTPPPVGAFGRDLLPAEVNPDITPAPKDPPPPCPPADPLKTPELAATGDVPGPPPEAEYTYRTSGTFEIGGANAQKGVLPPTSRRSVKNVAWNTARTAFEFDMVVQTGSQTTTTRYRVVPAKDKPQNPDTTPPTQLNDPYPQVPTVGVGSPASPGIYVVSIESSSPGREQPPRRVYNGGAGMLLVKLPVIPQERFESTATTGDVTVRYASRVGRDIDGVYNAHGRVDACGELLDSWTVTLDGTIEEASTGGRIALTFSAIYEVGTQFGALILEDHEVFDTVEGSGTPMHRESHAVINSVPKAAR